MKRLGALIVAVTVSFVLAAPAFGYGLQNPEPTPVLNCTETFAKQLTNGQLGNAGSKQFPTSVTDCDHFWQALGFVGNDLPGP